MSALDAGTSSGAGGRRCGWQQSLREVTTGAATAVSVGVPLAAYQNQRTGGAFILTDVSRSRLQRLKPTATDADIHYSTVGSEADSHQCDSWAPLQAPAFRKHQTAN